MTADNTLLQEVATLLGCLPAADDSTREYRIVRSSCDRFEFWRDDELVSDAPDGLTAVKWLMWAIGEGTVDASQRYLLVHAGAVSWNGRAMVVAGPSGAGKSTLVAALVDRGWSYMTDELVAVDVSTGRIRGSPRPLKLESSVNKLVGRDGSDDGPSFTNYWPLAPAPDHDGSTTMVVAPEVTGDARPVLSPMRTADAIVTLASSCWNLTRHRQQGLDVLASMARNPCFRVTLGDPAAAAELLGEELDRSAVSGT